MEIIEREELLEIMDYDPQTGEVTDKEGTSLLRTDSKGGYKIRIKGKAYPAAKLIYYFVYGVYPHKRGEIVFVDLCKSNLKLSNLHRVREPLSVEFLKHRFEYRDGKLYDKIKNKPVGISDSNGGLQVSIEGKYYGVQYIIYSLVHNIALAELPDLISYRDGNRLNNQVDNLVTGVRKDNTSGYTGVYLNAGRWSARYNDKFLGSFSSKAQAIKARKEEESK
jgi:hypothetical protein